QGYEQSLSAAISRMYALGQKGESILELKLGDSVPFAEPALQPLSPLPPTPSEQPLQPLELVELETSEPFSRSTTEQQPTETPSPPLYPFPGIEIPLTESEPLASDGKESDRDLARPVDIDAMDDSEIDALLQLEGDEGSEAPTADRSNVPLGVQEKSSETPTVPATASEPLSPEIESQLFGDFRDPALPDEEEPSAQRTASAAQQPLSLEAELFGSAPPQTAAPPSAGADTVVDAAETQPMPETDETVPNLADTITSLTELLEQAYTSSEPEEVETFSAVPPGENLWAADEAEIQQEPLAEQALEDSQLSEQLAEDLQRFGGESEPEAAEPSEESETTGAATTESFEPPAELLGEDLEAVDLEDLWSEHQHDDLASESGETENAALPAEIETDPWSEPASRASHPTEG
ncbi:MAG: hypothetical protein SVX43_03775, partial [Cyanobacteriota bacterium]|nr:hypothetical protein [Cyanobacteriota bacterium]